MGLTYVSPTQLGTKGTCDWAFEYAYKQRLTRPSTPVPLLTGSVLHNAREKWILDHSLDFLQLTRQAWRDLAQDTPLYRVVAAYEKLADKGRDLCAEILARRPDIKEPTRTKDYKEHEIGKMLMSFEHKYGKWLTEDKHDWESKSFTDSYNGTLNTAEKYQDKYRDSQPALLSELKYQVDHEGMRMVGVIDDIRLLISNDGEVFGYGIVDGKTYAQEPEPMKDFLQLASYRIAANYWLPIWLEQVGLEYNPDLPVFCGIDLMSLLEYRWYEYDDDQLKLALGIMQNYEKSKQAPPVPNFKGKCDWCEWVELCRDRVGMKPFLLEVA